MTFKIAKTTLETSVAVDLPPLARAASIAPESVDEEKRTAEVIWTTGARVMRGFFDRYIEELSLDPKHVRMDRLNGGGAPLLNAHNSFDMSDVIGVVESASLQKTRGVATVRFAKAEDDPAADAIFRKVKDGIIKNVSVGYRVHKLVKVEDGEDKIPVYRAEDWEPFEISAVPIGADAGAVFRAEDPKQAPNKCVFVTRQEQTMPTVPPESAAPTTPAPAPGVSAAVEATRAASAARVDDAKKLAEAKQVAADEAVAAERARASAIRKIAARAGLPESWSIRCIEEQSTEAEAREAAFDFIAKRDDSDFAPIGGATIGAGDDERQKFLRGASAWLLQRSGMRSLMESAKKKDPELFKDLALDPGEFRGMTPYELAKMCLERAGVNTRGLDRMRVVGMAFTQRSVDISHRGNFQTTGDFPVLLENVLSKVLLGAYATQINTWERIAKVDEVPDFRTSNRYRTASLPGLDVIAEHAEYKNGAIPDGAKYPISTQRMGKMFGLSREVIVNDDMGALLDMATKLGQAAQRSIENAVYALITANSGLGPTQADTQPFFHANRANVNATGSAISVDGLEADAVVLSQQKDPNAQDFLDLQPAVLLVPRGLKGTAMVLNSAEFDVSVSNKFQVPNRVRGLFREVVATPRLTGTRRYIIADPLDWIVVAFLEGYGRGPIMESQEGWRIDGVEWKVTLYAKPQMGDPKAAVTNAGA